MKNLMKTTLTHIRLGRRTMKAKLYDYKGETNTLRYFTEKYDLPHIRIKSRLLRGRTVEEAFNKEDMEQSEKYFKIILSIDPRYSDARERMLEIQDIRKKQRQLDIFKQSMMELE